MHRVCRAGWRDGLGRSMLRECCGGFWEVGVGCGVRIFRGRGILGVKEEVGCLELVSGSGMHKEGGRGSGCLGLVLGSGMQEFWELEVELQRLEGI